VAQELSNPVRHQHYFQTGGDCDMTEQEFTGAAVEWMKKQ